MNPSAFPAWTAVFAFLFGSAIGSFLNVVIYRMPRGLSIANPKHSFCPSCRRQLSAIDLVPIFSGLFLRGKCRQCGERVSPRYMVVELITGSLWAAAYVALMTSKFDPAGFLAVVAMISCLVAVIFIDWQYYIIPDQVNAFILGIGLVYNVWLIAAGKPGAFTMGLPSALAGWLTGWAILWGISFLGRVLFKKDAMGHGDIKLARGIGAVLFPAAAVISFALAVVLGAVFGILQVILRPKHQSNQDDDEDEEEYLPESLGSLVKCGIGYLFCLDVIGLAVPSFYMRWFGEDPFEPVVKEGEEEFEAGLTMIPFGPYLALGAIAASLFRQPLVGIVNEYWKWAAGPGPALEHLIR